jgi:peptidoglycan/LPS O-acetylase OafA/YrhL
VIDNAAMFHLRGFSMKSAMAVSSTHIVGLLRHNPFPSIMNGSLWTLPVELLCYIAAAILAALGVMQRRRIVVLALFAVLLGVHEFNCVNPEAFRRCFPFFSFDVLSNLCFYFSAGSVCFLYREKIPYSKALFFGSICLAGLSLVVAPLAFLAPIALPYSFLCLGFKASVGRFNPKGDYSYGTYIYAFPVQQGLALLSVQEAGFGVYLASSLLVTGILAVLSYRYVEAPCLRWKGWDLAATLRTWFGTSSRPALAIASAETPGRTVLRIP